MESCSTKYQGPLFVLILGSYYDWFIDAYVHYLSRSHSSSRKTKQWQDNLKAEYALPNSAPAPVNIPTVAELSNSETDSATARSQSADEAATETKDSKQQKQPRSKSQGKLIGKGDHSIYGRGLDKTENAKEKSNTKGSSQRSEVKKEKSNAKRVPPKPKLNNKGNKSSAEKLPLLQWVLHLTFLRCLL